MIKCLWIVKSDRVVVIVKLGQGPVDGQLHNEGVHSFANIVNFLYVAV